MSGIEITDEMVEAARTAYRPMHAREADYLSVEDNVREIVEAVAPLIADQAMERAAQVAEPKTPEPDPVTDDIHEWVSWRIAHRIAEQIRALKQSK